MKISINAFVGIIIIVIAMVLNVSVILMHQEVVNARHYHSSVINQIEASNFNTLVIEEVQKEAVSNGMCTGVKLEAGEKSCIVVEKIKTHEDKVDLKVTLKFATSIPILGVTRQNILEGYAR